MVIIPAIDIIDGKCVRLEQGDYDKKKIYSQDPLEVAKSFEDAGIMRLHLVDLDGARSGQIKNWKVLERISGKTALLIDFGGGMHRDEDLRIAFESGASQVTSGSVAAKDPDLFHRWLEFYGPSRIILGADVREDKIAVSAWKEDTELDIIPFLKDHLQKDLSYVICTEISKDGMLAGPALELYRNILSHFSNLNLIASGGVSSMEDLDDLRDLNLFGVIIGKALYEGRIQLKDLERYV
jgi:phosphoribosylformimino-5-aminoimidazole carboxamide ribotide isomerase